MIFIFISYLVITCRASPLPNSRKCRAPRRELYSEIDTDRSRRIMLGPNSLALVDGWSVGTTIGCIWRDDRWPRPAVIFRLERRCGLAGVSCSLAPGPHRSRQHCSGPVCDRPSASRLVPSRQTARGRRWGRFWAGTRSDGRKRGRNSADGCGEDRALADACAAVHERIQPWSDEAALGEARLPTQGRIAAAGLPERCSERHALWTGASRQNNGNSKCDTSESGQLTKHNFVHSFCF